MRYRPFRATGGSVSAITASFCSGGLDGRTIEQAVQAGLTGGVNIYEVGPHDGTALKLVGEALGGFERELVKVVLRIGGGESGFAPAALMAQVEQAAGTLGLGAIDVLMLERPSAAALTPALVDALRQAHQAGLFTAVGVRAEGVDAEALVRCGAFKVLATRFNLLSGWQERNLIRLAVEHGMTVTGHGFIGGELQADGAAPPKPKRGFLGLVRRKEPASELARADGYAFLRGTPGWSDEAICLAYALTEPSLATVQVEIRSAEQLAALTAVPERDLPANLAAQIEMARFAAVA